MTIELVVTPQEPPKNWYSFLDNTAPYSIALDGFVSDGPRFENYYANFNHHEGVDRLATRATCAQVLMALRQGLFRTFRDTQGPRATVYVNDCDEDVCLSWYLLKNHSLCEQTINPLVNRLVMMEDALDATAGVYPFPKDLPVLRELAWIFEPYRRFRSSTSFEKKNPADYRGVIEDVTSRIARHVTGNGDEIALDTRYVKTGGGTGWTMVEEQGAQARTGMFSDGIAAYVSVRPRADKRYTYTIGRMSPFVPFDIDRIFLQCNSIENTPGEKWGGSDMVGGSPRVSGSAIDPTQLTGIIEEVIRATTSP